MRVREWLLSRNTEGVGSRGVISRSAWADVARAADEGMTFDDYDPSIPGKVTKPHSDKVKRVTHVPVVKINYPKIVSPPIVRKNKEMYTYLKGSGHIVLAFAECSKCGNHISRCPCKSVTAPRISTGEVFIDKPVH